MSSIATLRLEIEQAQRQLDQLDAPPLERPDSQSPLLDRTTQKQMEMKVVEDIEKAAGNNKLVNRLEAELKASKEAFAKDVVAVQALELEKVDLTFKLVLQQAGIDKLGEGIAAVMQAKSDTIAMELGKMNESVAIKEEAVDDLNGDIAHLIEDSKKTAAKQKQLYADVKEAQTIVDSLAGQAKIIADLNARIKTAEEQSKAYGVKIAQAKSQAQQRERETKDIEGRIEAVGKSAAEKSALLVLEKDIEELKHRQADLEGDIGAEQIELVKLLENSDNTEDQTPNPLDACTDARTIAACKSLEGVPDVPLAALRLDRGTSLTTIDETKFKALTTFVLKQHRAIVEGTEQAHTVTSKRDADLAKEKEEQRRLEAMIDGHYERDAHRRASSPDPSFSSYGGIDGPTSVKSLEDRIHRRVAASIKLKARSAKLAEQILAAQVDQLERIEEMMKENEA